MVPDEIIPYPPNSIEPEHWYVMSVEGELVIFQSIASSWKDVVVLSRSLISKTTKH